jgi:TPR repeat protein
MFNFAKKRINRLTEKARSGDLQAQYELGMNYSKGIDVHVNKALAWSWILESANGGFAEAQATISALILKDNIDDNLKLAEAFSYAQASANQGNGLVLQCWPVFMEMVLLSKKI